MNTYLVCPTCFQAAFNKIYIAKSFQDPDPDNISSVGLGVLWHPADRIAAKVYWGYALRKVDDYGEHDLQDDGIHFAIGAAFF